LSSFVLNKKYFYKYQQSSLQQKNHRDADPENFLAGFMFKITHADGSAQASPDQTKKQQNFFRNTPLVFSRFTFIDAKQKKCYQIYRTKINGYDITQIH
jgi:hypothetical protein